ncbi:MAG: 4Fe-4S binding protein [Termitinemataceae bacterium]|nr:MAG: 4Fe-4S binding protein [Termitinemataceae bacterium]
MKKLAIKDKEACMACKTCEIACSQAFYKKGDTSLSCIIIGRKDDSLDSKVKISVCVQCGKCAEACAEKAITKNAKGVWTIDKKLCKNCDKCIEACPFGLVVKDKGAANPSKCISCGICAKQCPQDILYIKED